MGSDPCVTGVDIDCGNQSCDWFRVGACQPLMGYGLDLVVGTDTNTVLVAGLVFHLVKLLCGCYYILFVVNNISSSQNNV